MKDERAKRIPLRPLGTSPILGEEFDKNISSGVGAGAHFMRYTPEDTG